MKMEKREIKFRGMDKRNHTWVYGSYHSIKGTGIMRSRAVNERGYIDEDVTFNQHMIFAQQLPDTSGWSYGDTYFPYDVYEESVGQFTGLKDKNVVDLYEGDIISVKPKGANYPIKYVVVFNDKLSFRMRFIDRYKNMEGSFYDEEMKPDTFDTFEVIGNVFEHPHLLTLKSQ